MFTVGAAKGEAQDLVQVGRLSILFGEGVQQLDQGTLTLMVHDDIVWTQGPIYHPDWYREYVFPNYARLFAPILEGGKRLMYCSDGNFTEFIDDLADAGAGGFIFEPLTDLKVVVEKYGQTHVIVGNIDCRALTFEDKDAIEAEVKRCYDTAGRCPGFFYAVGNHIPYNVPVENALYYYECIRRYGKRE